MMRWWHVAWMLVALAGCDEQREPPRALEEASSCVARCEQTKERCGAQTLDCPLQCKRYPDITACITADIDPCSATTQSRCVANPGAAAGGTSAMGSR